MGNSKQGGGCMEDFTIYKELERVPVNVEHIRSAFNMSKDTTERLREFSKVRRIPLQDLVELAVLDLLAKYDIEGGNQK